MPRPQLRRPPREVLSRLSPTERVGYEVGALINETPVGKWSSSAYLTYCSRPWMGFLMDAVSVKVGLEHVPKDRAYILAANHRTFWDFYCAMCQIWPAMPKDHKPYLYCPVRSKFFYTRPSGIALNLLVSAHAMYPPIFRDDRGAALNQLAVEKCVELLRWHPRTVVAIHPEGKRNPDPDPYALLPAKPGVGRIALQSEAPVIPLFLSGIPQSLGEVTRNRMGRKRGAVRMHFGPPVGLGDLFERRADPVAHQEASERIMARIAGLGEEDRAARAAAGTPVGC